MTDLIEALRSGAVRVVPVEPTLEMMASQTGFTPEGLRQEYQRLHDLKIKYSWLLAASPDHTPALLALIEGLRKERAVAEDVLAEVAAERDEADAEITSTEILLADERRIRFAAEAERDALREALAAEREACARVAESLPGQRGNSPEHLVGNRIAHSIRARALTQETNDG